MRKLFRNKFTYIVAMTLVCAMSLAACGNKNAKAETESKKAVQNATESTKKAEKTEKIALSDGTYTAEFTTDSSMFHVNDAYDNKGTLTVKDGKATIHVALTSTHIVNLFLGTAKDASKDKAELLEPTVETVDYGDGTTEEVNAFDIPVPVLDEEFDLALIGTKGKWYDHKVKVSNATPADADASVSESAGKELPDGTYNINLDFEGGSGKASIASPAEVTISGGAAIATVQWSSPNYDYMIVDGQKYMPVNTDGNSVTRLYQLVRVDRFRKFGPDRLFELLAETLLDIRCLVLLLRRAHHVHQPGDVTSLQTHSVPALLLQFFRSSHTEPAAAAADDRLFAPVNRITCLDFFCLHPKRSRNRAVGDLYRIADIHDLIA